MNHCEIVRDLMPLCIDQAASEASEQFVQEHIAGCSECRRIMETMQGELCLPFSAAEQQESAGAFRKVRRALVGKMLKATAAAVCILALLALLCAGLIYSRPMSLSEMTGLDVSRCEALSVYYERYPEDQGSGVQYRITADDPQFDAVLRLLTERSYRRSLRSLLPQTSKLHVLRDGDFKWELGLVLMQPQDVDGEMLSGYLVHVENFFGQLEIQSVGRGWQCSTQTQEQWAEQILSLLEQN